MNADEKLLDDYRVELGCQQLTLAQLISGHRTMRAASLQSHAEKIDAMMKTRQWVIKTETERLQQFGWFSRERLSKMTLAEIADIISEN